MSAPSRPNVLWLLTDDQGPWAVPWRMPELRMPALAELAEDGLVLDNYYCTSPVCSPSRASLLTGRMPSAHGVHDWLVGTRAPQAHPDQYLDDVVTLPALLAGTGYVCGLSGKWHVGESRQPAPGFTSWYAHRFGGGPYYGAPIWDDGAEASEPEYFTDAVGHHAVDFLERYAAGTLAPEADDAGLPPFFLQVCTTAPHDPWDADNHPDELLALYEDCAFESVPRPPRHPWTEPRRADFEDAFTDPLPSLRGYCAALSGVDRLLGRLRQTLSNLGLADDTIIVYMSDNGFSCGHHGVWGKGNGTYPLNMWENSVRVPCVIYVPPAWRHLVNDRTGHVDDHLSAASFLPTVCELTSTPLPDDPLRAAPSALPVLRGQAHQGEPVVVHDEYGGTRMIRQGAWKYVTRHEGPTELYDLDSDPHEEHNLAEDEAYAQQRADLHERLTTWFRAHETAQHRAFDQPVTGFGQIHPTWRRDEEQRYMPMHVQADGVRH